MPSQIAVPNTALPANPVQPFDFRSSRFCDDAQALARATGQSVQQCRQALFIAEGDAAMAFELLMVEYGVEPAGHTLH